MVHRNLNVCVCGDRFYEKKKGREGTKNDRLGITLDWVMREGLFAKASLEQCISLDLGPVTEVTAGISAERI